MAIRVKIPHDGKKTLAQLEAELNAAEATIGPLVSIGTDGRGTISTHEQLSAVPPGSLFLRLDPERRPTRPEEPPIVASGEAILEGNRVRVGVFRRV